MHCAKPWPALQLLFLAIVYVCGSLQGMAAGVDAVLLDLLGQDGLDDLRAQGLYRRDVY